METTSKIYQLKQIVKDIAVLQRTIKNHRKTVKFNGERETVTLVTYVWEYDARAKKYMMKEHKDSKIYLTPHNAENLLNNTYAWSLYDDKSNVKEISEVNIVPMNDIHFTSTTSMAHLLNLAYALLRYERKTKKNDKLEALKKEVEEGRWTYLKKIIDYFRDEEQSNR
jgi:hypothetical protein